VLRATPFALYFAGMVAMASLLFIAQVPELEGKLYVLAFFIALTVLAEFVPVAIYGESRVSVGFVPVMAIIILFGAPGASIAALTDATASAVSRRKLDVRAPMNAALWIVIYSAGAGAYALVAPVHPARFEWSLLPAVGFATVVTFTANAVLLGMILRLTARQPFYEIWDKYRWLAPHYVTFGFIGLALALAYTALGLFGVLAFIAPAAMMRLAMKQYVDKTKENVEKLNRQNEVLQRANIEVLRVSHELRESYDGTLEALVNALDARDQETKGHSIRVSHYMLQIARAMGVREGSTEWEDMQRGSLLHDVGKIGVNDAILRKPGKLTDEEWTQMRLHPEIGYNMLRQVTFLQGAAELILAHHERWDGKGYPRGLHEDEIPLGARIFMVVDTFDSMTSDRPYRKALSTLDALNEILRCSGSQFDPRVVEAFLDIYDQWVKEREELHKHEELARAA
jgi:putative nucleotidyltransferase with HDIG domain